MKEPDFLEKNTIRYFTLFFFIVFVTAAWSKSMSENGLMQWEDASFTQVNIK